MKHYLLNILFGSILIPLFGQTNNKHIHIAKTAAAITIDGEIRETVWQEAQMVHSFWFNYPNDQEASPTTTEVRLTYNETHLFVGVVYYTKTAPIVQTLKRDTDFWAGDGFSLVLDPMNQRTSGYIFGISPFGVQMEGLITGNVNKRGEASKGFNLNWNNTWIAESTQFDNRWEAEMAIPFKILNFDTSKTSWGINFIRRDIKSNTYQCWSPVPLQFQPFDLGYTGTLSWDTPPSKTQGNITLIPYSIGSVTEHNTEDQTIDFNEDFGIDAKLALNSSLNLDITINPDFSQVAIDQQVTNLTRFDIQLPEQRLFFLENADIFEDFGTPDSRPFISRRIGLDTSGNAIPILYGIRLSGNLNKDMRIGFMNVHTNGNSSIIDQNYTALGMHQKLFERSMLKAFFLNRQAFDRFNPISEDYGRNLGLEFSYVSPNGNHRFWSGYTHGFKDDIAHKNYAINAGFSLGNKNWNAVLNYDFLGDNYYADMGFLKRIEHFEQLDPITGNTVEVRQGVHSLESELTYMLFPKNNDHINAHQFKGFNRQIFTPSGTAYDRNTNFEYELQLASGAEWEFEINNYEVELFKPLQFTDKDRFEPLPVKRYNYSSVELEYESSDQNKIIYELGITYGSFYNGTRTSLQGDINYRAQPWGNFGLGFDYNDLQFPGLYGNAHPLLMNSSIALSFSKHLFWTTFAQYNTSNDNFNINSRLQWRFKPMSDLFIVYTDNYGIAPFAPKNRALVIKLNYWLNF